MQEDFDISLLRKSIQLSVNEVVQQLERKREQVALEQIETDSFLTTLDKACSILKKLEGKKEVEKKEKTSKKQEMSYVMKKYIDQ